MVDPNSTTDRDTDERGITRFTAVMRNKLAVSRANGRGGWQFMCNEDLWLMLREHVAKGDPVDVANFAMMIWNNQERTP